MWRLRLKYHLRCLRKAVQLLYSCLGLFVARVWDAFLWCRCLTLLYLPAMFPLVEVMWRGNVIAYAAL
jgi:hypothetical protein